MSKTAVILDTSVGIDFYKMPSRQAAISAKLSEFEHSISGSIGLLEFKAVLIQELITIHNRLAKDELFTIARDNLIESQHKQSRLRAHIFNNILEVFPAGPTTFTEQQDRRLAEDARLKLEMIIPEIYKDYRERGMYLPTPIGCNRSSEAPTKRPSSKAFDTNIPKCKRGKNKSCHVEEVVRERVSPLLRSVIPLEVQSAPIHEVPRVFGQLRKALDTVKKVEEEPDFDMDSSDCRSIGDALIVAECSGSAKHALSTNATEWEPLCKAAGIEFVRMTYPD